MAGASFTVFTFEVILSAQQPATQGVEGYRQDERYQVDTIPALLFHLTLNVGKSGSVLFGRFDEGLLSAVEG